MNIDDFEEFAKAFFADELSHEKVRQFSFEDIIEVVDAYIDSLAGKF